MRYPIDDISDLPQHIQDAINAYWTDEIKQSWIELVEKAQEETGVDLSE